MLLKTLLIINKAKRSKSNQFKQIEFQKKKSVSNSIDRPLPLGLDAAVTHLVPSNYTSETRPKQLNLNFILKNISPPLPPSPPPQLTLSI